VGNERLYMSSVVDAYGTRRGVLARCRRTARHRFTRRAGWVALGLVGSVLLLGPLRSLLVLSLGVAIGVVVAFAALGAIAAVFVHRTAHEPTAPSVTDIGHRSETTHDDVRVHSVQRARGGAVTVRLSWQSRHRIELDPSGLPLGVGSEGSGTCAWAIPAALVPDDAALDRLQLLVGAGLSLVEHGEVQAVGTTVTRRVLASSQGVVLDLRC
jgi:hypothetical protein